MQIRTFDKTGAIHIPAKDTLEIVAGSEEFDTSWYEDEADCIITSAEVADYDTGNITTENRDQLVAIFGDSFVCNMEDEHALMMREW